MYFKVATSPRHQRHPKEQTVDVQELRQRAQLVDGVLRGLSPETYGTGDCSTGRIVLAAALVDFHRQAAGDNASEEMSVDNLVMEVFTLRFTGSDTASIFLGNSASEVLLRDSARALRWGAIWWVVWPWTGPDNLRTREDDLALLEHGILFSSVLSACRTAMDETAEIPDAFRGEAMRAVFDQALDAMEDLVREYQKTHTLG